MLNRIGYFFFGVLCILIGNTIFATKKFKRAYIEHDFSQLEYFYLIPGTAVILFGLSLFYLAFRSKKYIKPYIDPDKGVKCPKCKKSYNYVDTNKGKCPTCNIDTIDIDDYYKKFPKELKDAGK